MAWFAVALPWITAGLGAMDSVQKGQQAKLNARIMRDHARGELSTAARDEETQRRDARMQIGRQVAATGEAGGGYGGSAGLLLEQSAVLAELDALNIRYGGQLRARESIAGSYGLQREARGAGLLAGGRLLAGASRAYTSNKLMRLDA